jgi:hypothetical protein
MMLTRFSISFAISAGFCRSLSCSHFNYDHNMNLL